MKLIYIHKQSADYSVFYLPTLLSTDINCQLIGLYWLLPDHMGLLTL